MLNIIIIIIIKYVNLIHECVSVISTLITEAAHVYVTASDSLTKWIDPLVHYCIECPENKRRKTRTSEDHLYSAIPIL